MKTTLRLTLFSLCALPLAARAELKTPAIIGDNMVLQQKQFNPIWGWDAPGTEVTVQFAGQTKTATVDAKGKWTVKLDPVPANSKPQTLTLKGTSTKEIKNVLVGEVWVCSGQSNMGFTVSSATDADLEMISSKYPRLRLIEVPNVGIQEPQDDFKGAWAECTPESCKTFSAVGFFYGRLLHQILDVPVGLIDNAWGGSACEAWVKRSVLEKDPRFADLMARWRETEATYDFAKVTEAHQKLMADWKLKVAEARKAGKPAPTPPRAPQNQLTGQHRPGNLYSGCLHPFIGYGIKGAIWYQGESNASRAYEYEYLFPLMIQHWRDEWQQGDFPFYWVQLADFKAEQADPGDCDWAELREAQTKTMSKLKNTGQAVITDLGEAKDIHPKNKRDVAERLARWALAKDYGINVPYHSPEYKSMQVQGNKAVVTLDTFGSVLQTFDVADVKGFAICGKDGKWTWADAKILGADKVEVSSKAVAEPFAVRYAWSDNPICNLYSRELLPVTPFRTDSFPSMTKTNAEKLAALSKKEEVRKAQMSKKSAAQAAKPKAKQAK